MTHIGQNSPVISVNTDVHPEHQSNSRNGTPTETLPLSLEDLLPHAHLSSRYQHSRALAILQDMERMSTKPLQEYSPAVQQAVKALIKPGSTLFIEDVKNYFLAGTSNRFLSTIGKLPDEIIHQIFGELMHEEEMNFEQMGLNEESAKMHIPAEADEKERTAARERARIPEVCKFFSEIDSNNLNTESFSTTALQISKNAINAFASYSSMTQFSDAIQNLFAKHKNIGMDASVLSAEQLEVTLEKLKERASTGDLLAVKIETDFPDQNDSLKNIDSAIDTIRQQNTGIEINFHCKARSDTDNNAPDFSKIRNLTFVEIKYPNMVEPPNFSTNKGLKSAHFNDCDSLVRPPDFSQNEELRAALFSNCRSLLSPPDFSQNWHLTVASFRDCGELGSQPDFSQNPNLLIAEIEGNDNFTSSPNFSNNPNLKIAFLSNFGIVGTPPDFSNNNKLRVVMLSDWEILSVPPDFSNKPDLTNVAITECLALAQRANFSNSPNVRYVNYLGCENLPPPSEHGSDSHVQTILEPSATESLTLPLFDNESDVDE